MTGPVEVHDIKDAEAFVRANVYRKLRKLRDGQEFEEMVQEGYVILFDLARRYDPSKDVPSRKPGHVCKGERCCKASFASYAARLLPPKLLDAWHSHHPEHLLRTQPDGSRKYVYLMEACSFDDTGGIHSGFVDKNPSEPGVDSAGFGRNTIDRPATRHVGMFMPVPEINPS